MIRKLATFTFATALLALPFSSISSAPGDAVDPSSLKQATVKNTNTWIGLPRTSQPEAGNNNEVARYLVQFEGDALPRALGNGNGRLDTRSSAALAFVNDLQSRQGEMLAKISSEAGAVEVLRTHQHALNAATVRMSAATARKVRSMPGVRSVERDREVQLETATSVPFIGADQVWDGSASGGIGFLGEGIVVGIIDSGINHDHPSFAATGDDGYTVVNPLGDGVYLGECASIAGLCNSKLIGAYTFLDSQPSDPPDEILIPGDPPSTDTDGHGTHVAGTAAGNILYDIALPDADGNPGSIVFDQISGVAPHANVVAYKVCAPSCFTVDIFAAVDQAIADGVVDVLNHSISSGPGSPWNSLQAQAFLNARAAGIFVANSAGNSGPDAGTAEAGGNAPWAAAVAATTHDRSYPPKFLQDMSGGDTAAPADITGASVSGGITGTIVYAGDFPTSNGSSNDTEPEQCLDPFPAGTFTSDQIVMCDRGAIARVAKGQNVRDGGAGGFILGNTDGGATSVNADGHVIPAIHINATDAAAMRSWLASGTDHTGTITAVDTAITDPAAGDNVASFSSRGPYTGFDILAPNTAAPGVDILAAGAEMTQEQIDLAAILYAGTAAASPAVPGSYGSIGGTSMSSPHIAGSAALLKQAHPEWTDAEVLSAIMTTGSYDLVKEDGVTPADIHDFGGGRIQLPLAVNAGLVLDESSADFEAANPDLGGDPSALNVAALIKQSCVQSCTWTRTVTATVDGSWTTSGFDPWVTVSPASFSLAAGETQEIEVTADASALPGDVWSFSRAVLTPDDASVPTSQIPLAVVPVSGDLPASIDIRASRDAGSQLFTDNTALEMTGFNVKIYRPAKVVGRDYAVAQDSDNSSPYDDLSDGVNVTFHQVNSLTQRTLIQTLESASPDLDLFVGLVVDEANPVDEIYEVCRSTTASAIESCDFDAELLQALRDFLGTKDFTLYVLVQNWQASAPDAVDAFELASTNVGGGSEATNMVAEGPSGTVPLLEPFDVRFFWDGFSQSGRYISATEWYGDTEQTRLLGKVPLNMTRGDDDVVLSTDPQRRVRVEESATVKALVEPNFTNEDRTYVVEIEVSDSLSIDPDSITEGGTLENGDTVVWTVTQESLLGAEGSYSVSTNADNEACDTGFGGYVNLADFGIGPVPTLVGDSFSGTLFSGQNPISFFGADRDSGLTVTDDGFGFFNSTPGPVPFFNLPIPTELEPNDMLAPMWSDWIIEPVVGGGISAATAGGDVSIVEWDNVEYWSPTGPDTNPVSGDFEIILFSTVSPDRPEFVFAYANIDEEWNEVLQGNVGAFTTGVENSTGTAGSAYTGPITDGLIVCLDYEEVPTAPRELSFTGTVIKKKTVKVEMTSTVDNPGSEAEEQEIKLKVSRAKKQKET